MGIVPASGWTVDIGPGPFWFSPFGIHTGRPTPSHLGRALVVMFWLCLWVPSLRPCLSGVPLGVRPVAGYKGRLRFSLRRFLKTVGPSWLAVLGPIVLDLGVARGTPILDVHGLRRAFLDVPVVAVGAPVPGVLTGQKRLGPTT